MVAQEPSVIKNHQISVYHSINNQIIEGYVCAPMVVAGKSATGFQTKYYGYFEFKIFPAQVYKLFSIQDTENLTPLCLWRFLWIPN